MSKLCYISAFIDIGRENWSSFQRCFQSYLNAFRPYIEMFDNLEKNNITDYEMIVYVGENVYNDVKREIHDNKLIKVVKVNENFLVKHTMWSRLGRETEIVNSDDYKFLLRNKLHFPEHNNPKYTLVNHIKIDFVCLAMDITNAPYLCWTDFGYFASVDRIPKNPINIEKMVKDRINYTLINPLDENDSNIIYTMLYAPERIGGFFFFGNRDTLKKYQELYWKIHKNFQDINLVDDDQHLVLRCYFDNKDLFHFHMLGGWHRALTHFQNDDTSL